MGLFVSLCSVRSLLWAGSSLLWAPELRLYMDSMRKEGGGELVGMCTLCRVEEGTVFLSALPLGVPFCLTKPGLALVQC